MKQTQPAFPEAALVKSLTNKAGLYLHIPFCEKKCKYCDFYSSFVTEELLDEYSSSLCDAIKEWGGSFNRPIDTIYLGGGTPSLMKHRLVSILNTVKTAFKVSKNSEITLEVNPEGDIKSVLEYAKKAEINRLSIGMQSGNDYELKVLGRRHSVLDTINAVNEARSLGFDNISLDLMLGLPDSSIESLEKSLEVLCKLNPEHISAYILKIEENTVFFKQKESLNLPDDDMIAEQYLFVCDYLKKKGYEHYEISNFCKNGMMSRHNLKYWQGDEYLGLGPAAHSYFDGKRYFYPRSLKDFLNGNEPLFDDFGGTREEYIMLNLRLKKGLCPNAYAEKFGKSLSENFFFKCESFKKAGLMEKDKNISLTDKGMLVSNAIITELLECL